MNTVSRKILSQMTPHPQRPKKRLLGGICTYNSDEETEPSKQYMGTVPEGKDYCQEHDPDNICKGVKVVKGVPSQTPCGATRHKRLSNANRTKTRT